MSEEEKSNLDNVYDAMLLYKQYVGENALSDDEKVITKIQPKDSDKRSTVKYTGSEGTFNIVYDPATKQASVKAKFVTGSFSATVEADNLVTKGQAPVYHQHFGVFHNGVFNKE